MRTGAALFAIICLAAAAPGAAEAAKFTVGGLEFSDELGGFRLLSVTGKGTKDDPIVVVEEIDGGGTAVLVIRGLIGRKHLSFGAIAIGFRVRKVVINATNAVWSRFDLELREDINKPSTYTDGLSFDQAKVVARPMTSDKFLYSQNLQEPYDGIQYAGGIVHSGQSVTFDFSVTDPTPNDEFFLLQTTAGPMSGREPDDEPALAAIAPRPGG